MKIPPAERKISSRGKIVIGDNVWIGDKATVLAGVHIGEGVVIGANSVVTHDIPPYCVAVGNPATVIKKNK
ncbi:MAG: DapH/DapD/GlmU-related protein [Prevotella sp.]